MDDLLAVGPVVVHLILPLLVIAALVGQAVAYRAQQDHRANARLDRVLLVVTVGFFLGARVGHVWHYHQVYAAYPLSILDLTDSGWSLPAGMAVSALLCAVATRRHPSVQRAAWMGLGSAGLIVLAGFILFSARTARTTTLPTQSLTTPQGTTVSLASLRGRPVVINLWAVWCPPCRAELPDLLAAAQRHPNVAFVFADQGDPADKVTAFLRANTMVHSGFVLDPNQDLGRAYSASAIPLTLFFDAHGNLLARHAGMMNAATLARHLQDLGLGQGALP